MLESFKAITNKKLLIKKLQISTLAFTSLFLLNNTVLAKNVDGLTPTQLQQLKLLSLPVLVPSYIPKGFSLSSVSILNVGSTVGSSYKITYKKTLTDGKTSEFFIETANDGIGEIFLSNPLKVKTKFGDTQIYVDAMTENDTNIKVDNCIYMDWLCYKNNCYRLVSGGACTDDKEKDWINRISKEDAIKVIQSIHEIK